MDPETVQFVVDTLADYYKFDPGAAARIIMLANARDTPAYQKAIAAQDATKLKIEEMKAKIAAGKPRKGSDLPAKLAELEKKLQEQQARADEIAANVTSKKKRAPKAAEQLPAPEQPPAEDKPEPKAKKAKEPAPEKRIKRMYPALIKHITNVFDETRTEMPKDAIPNFSKYINELTKDDFDAKSLTDHMREYVSVIARGEVPNAAPKTDTIPTMTYEKLMETKASLIEQYGPGVYWNTETKSFVVGPVIDDDEDVTETSMDGLTYAVGDKTKRVYREVNGIDVFEGFLGIGKFANMKV
jgi:hypothetical protein